MTTLEETPRCACCGALSITHAEHMGALLAVCDVLVIKALESLGKRLVRVERARFRTMGTRPWHVAHTLWPPDDTEVTKALKGAWDVVPAMLDSHGCCGLTSRQVSDTLNDYVHDLTITGSMHSLDELEYRLITRLGLTVGERRAHA